MMNGRAQPHATLVGGGARTLEVRYRSPSSFLVAYAVHLSKGELFLETTHPLPLGAKVSLRLGGPFEPPLELVGHVTAVRPAATGPGHPAGIRIALDSSIEAHGPRIDQLAARYSPIRILLAMTEPTSRAIVGRYLRSILTCELVEVGGGTGTETPPLEDNIELCVVDLDASGSAAEALVQTLKFGAVGADIPVIALAQSEQDRARGGALGAEEVLPNPPAFPDLQASVIHALSRPASWSEP